MDEGKSAKSTGPKPKRWGRPRRAAAADPHPEAPAGNGPADPAFPAAEQAAEPPQRALPGENDPEAAAGAEEPGPGRSAPEAGGTGRAPGEGAGTQGSPPGAARDASVPLHAEDPYRTPPYGGPGPWAPAPPVQLPGTTPPHGTPGPGAPADPPYPVHGAPGPGTPAHGTSAGAPEPRPASAALSAPPPGTPPAGPPSGPWQRYDPWAAPLPAASGPQQPAPRGGPRRLRLLSGALLLALVAGLAGGAVGAYAERNGGFTTVELPQAPAEQSGKRAPGSVAGIAETALPGVVTLRVAGLGGRGTGTGFVLDDRGHILTNHHVVESAAEGGTVQVTFHSGQTVDAQVVGGDSGYDLAVVRVDGVSGLHPLPLGNSDSVRVGDPVIAIGAPYDLEGTVTTGIISAKERPITAGGEGAGSDVSYVDALQTDASINPGNSGGPLVDARGRVIGINSAIRSADGGSGLPGGQGGSIGLGFAIPVNQAKRVAEELINTGRATHPVIGVTLDLAYAGDGARVVAAGGGSVPVTPGGPGDRAGIEPGDVITEVGGEPVHSAEELIVRIRSRRPGDALQLTVERDGAERAVRLVLGSSGDG
ncbi:trypsin-like peptidase domain-containing protein [Streptomyces sp. JJ36]|uniref:trypsin-like peptidase domain-containing protein n=1 Tax=Streptomyces sp. JJ36 TaxID=2736645 RepID=UPI001F42849E|nr:trypsin-like peptidase domain-containing protein [Streptomyces sp. JJ36]MCF6525538.1 trypsin-like peptidase domain-containing protein [Streptomyces sp. JJ36]